MKLHELISPDRVERGLWWEKALSLVEGCTPVSPACDNCWGSEQANIRSKQNNPKIKAIYGGLTDDNGKWNGTVRYNHAPLLKAIRTKKPTVYAVWMDLFHEAISEAHIIEALVNMGSTDTMRRSVFLICTKRPDRMKAIVSEHFGAHPYPNIWFGVTVENQKYADERIPLLLATPAVKRFVSYEPALGPVNFSPYLRHVESLGESLDWIIAGGESGRNARPAHPDWFRSVRDQCAETGTPFWFKQWGEWIHDTELDPVEIGILKGISKPYQFSDTSYSHYVGKKRAGRLLDGVGHIDSPEVME